MLPNPQSKIENPKWRKWRWQMQNRINTVEALRQYIDPTDDELEAIEVTKNVFRWNAPKIVSTFKNGPYGAVFAGCLGLLSTPLSSLAGQS